MHATDLFAAQQPGVFPIALGEIAAIHPTAIHPAVSDSSPPAGYGNCTACPCPGFTGSTYTCDRGGCGHHYDSHW